MALRTPLSGVLLDSTVQIASADAPATDRASLVGLFLVVFAMVALTGPGRIDVVDGQARYEVARSLVDHGDHIIRDPNVWFGVFPGRDGKLYTKYRFPQTAAGVLAIVAADATGPVSEGRRHFFFVLIGAFACGVLAVAYALWFRTLGHKPGSALFWAAAGIFCTPSWFYGTSTFDDILGSAAVVLAVVTARVGRRERPQLGAAIAGIMLGLAVNCKQPLGVFVLPVFAAVHDARTPLRSQWARFAWVVAGLTLGVAAYLGYDLYKFPPGTTEAHAGLSRMYGDVWSGRPFLAGLVLLLSPAASILLYCPTIPLSLVGIGAWWRSDRLFSVTFAAAITAYSLVIVSMSFFKGDPAWGPRYFTPVFAALWLVTPSGAASVRRRTVIALVASGLVVQLLALSVDPHRLYVERGLPSGFGAHYPILYFHPAVSHLLNRPREIREIVSARNVRAERFAPGPTPTFAFPVIDAVDKGPRAVRKYHVLNSFRPWLLNQYYLSDSQKPVAALPTAVVILSLLLIGLIMQFRGSYRTHRR